MKRGIALYRLVFPLAVLLVLGVACGDDDGPSAEQTVGRACKNSDECKAISGGSCDATYSVCTRTCSGNHSDCGCAANYTPAELAKGACKAACLTFATIGNYCTRLCSKNSDCEVGTCTASTSPGIKYCEPQ